MKVQLIFKWFDFWIGIFYDQKKNWIYLLPIPMVGIIFKLPDNWRISSVGGSCDHPIEKLVNWHDDSILCDKCNCIIEQYGEKIDPPTSLV